MNYEYSYIPVLHSLHADQQNMAVGRFLCNNINLGRLLAVTPSFLYKKKSCVEFNNLVACYNSELIKYLELLAVSSSALETTRSKKEMLAEEKANSGALAAVP